MAATITNILPEDESNIGSDEPITFNLETPDALIAIWCKLANHVDTLLVYEDGEFFHPFDQFSTDIDVNGDGSLIAFSVRQNGGWEDDIEAFTIEPADEGVPIEDVWSEIWAPPATPHIWDEEFETTILSPSWNDGNMLSPSLGLPDAYDGAFVTPANPRTAYHTDFRPSWATFQMPVGLATDGYRMSKTGLVMPDEIVMYARMAFNTADGTLALNDGSIGLQLGIFPDAVIVSLNDQEVGNQYGSMYKWTATAFALIGRTTDVNKQGQALEYVALHKIGTTYHAWAGTASGNWIYIGSTTHATAFTSFGISIHGNTKSVPGATLNFCDFVRFKETTLFPFF